MRVDPGRLREEPTEWSKRHAFLQDPDPKFFSGRIEAPILGFVLLPHADRAEPHLRVLVCWLTVTLVGPRDSGRNFCSALVSPWRASVRVRPYTLCSDKTSTFHQRYRLSSNTPINSSVRIIINLKYACLEIAISGGSRIQTAVPRH